MLGPFDSLTLLLRFLPFPGVLSAVKSVADQSANGFLSSGRARSRPTPILSLSFCERRKITRRLTNSRNATEGVPYRSTARRTRKLFFVRSLPRPNG